MSGKGALCAENGNANKNDKSKNNNNSAKEQTQFLTDETFKDAIEKCMRTNPVDGMCAELPKFGAMPRWDTSKVTNMDLAFASSTSERKSRKSGEAVTR